MCGIAGIFGNFDLEIVDIKHISTIMKNRGPDFFSYEAYKSSNMSCIFFHSRLSIIDPTSSANQPFKNKRFSIIFNGEIYNYIELRNELSKLGCKFKTSSDTEVFLNAYSYWGDKSFEKFEGMWAAVIFDLKNFSIKLCRDRFGEKPLYFLKDKDTVYFSSETKYIHKLRGKRDDINLKHIKRFIVNGYKSLYKSTETFYKNIKYVNPSEILECKKNLNFKSKFYWNLKFKINKKIKFADCKNLIRDRFKTIIKQKLRSDVPISFCLSGGIDSNLLLYLADFYGFRKLNTFSIYDDNQNYDESENIEKTIKNLNITNHHSIKLEKRDFLTNLENQTKYNDAPLATISFFVSSLLAKKINKQKIKVTIQGNGADEIFTGYYHHYSCFLKSLKNDEFNFNFENWKNFYKDNIRNPSLNNFERFKKNSYEHIFYEKNKNKSFLNEEFNEEFEEKNFTNDFLRNRMLNEIKYESLPVLLNENDLAFMRYSVENRNLYLDSELCELIFSLPSNFLIKDGFLKFLLRNCFSDILPNHIKNDRKKKGFNASLSSLLDIKSKDFKDFILEDSEIYDVFDKKQISKLLDDYGEMNSEKKLLFSLITTKIFMEK